MITITTQIAKQLIKDSKGKIFAATYIKKDLSSRMMLARLGKKYTPKTNRAAPFKANDYNLIAAYDMHKKAFRMININTLTNLSINANKYIIK